MKFFSFQKLRPLFHLSQPFSREGFAVPCEGDMSRDASGESKVRNSEEIILYYTMSSWSKGLKAEHLETFAGFYIRGRVMHP